MREICERYGIPYNSGPLRKQFGSVVRKICRLALPDRRGDDGAPGWSAWSGGARRAVGAGRAAQVTSRSRPVSTS